MKLQVGKLYRDKDKIYEKSFIVITHIDDIPNQDAICTLFRLHAPDNQFHEYLDVLIDKVDIPENFDD